MLKLPHCLDFTYPAVSVGLHGLNHYLTLYLSSASTAITEVMVIFEVIVCCITLLSVAVMFFKGIKSNLTILSTALLHTLCIN